MGAQGEADRPLEQAVDQHADDGEHRQRRHPFGFLEPPGSDGRGGLAPTQTRCSRGIVGLRGVEHVRIAPSLSAHGRGQDHPALVLLQLGACLHVHPQARARRKRGRGHLGWTSPPRASRTAGGGDDTSASRVRPPRAWAAASVARPLGLIRRDGGGGLSLTGTPAGVHPLPVVCPGLGVLPWGAGICLGVLRGPLTRMHHEKAPCLRRHPPSAVLALRRPDDAGPMPPATRFGLGPPRLFCAEGPDGWLWSPGFQCLASRTGPWHEGHPAHPFFQTQAERPSTLRLALRPKPLAPLPAPGEARRKRARCLHTVTRMPIPPPEPPRPPPAPLTPRRRSPCVRAPRPSLLGPEAGRGAPGVWGASAYAPESPIVVVA